ncbi:MAG: hypothetical protein BWY88_00313 [Synergistetes bacterium ADurb.Bin520]|nr:MAG: hypothetical protein BWY88_00313 [Synergistetes bacterium ADurb.Bin520]
MRSHLPLRFIQKTFFLGPKPQGMEHLRQLPHVLPADDRRRGDEHLQRDPLPPQLHRGHEIIRKDLGDHALVSMATGELIPHPQGTGHLEAVVQLQGDPLATGFGSFSPSRLLRGLCRRRIDTRSGGGESFCGGPRSPSLGAPENQAKPDIVQLARLVVIVPMAEGNLIFFKIFFNSRRQGQLIAENQRFFLATTKQRPLRGYSSFGKLPSHHVKVQFLQGVQQAPFVGGLRHPQGHHHPLPVDIVKGHAPGKGLRHHQAVLVGKAPVGQHPHPCVHPQVRKESHVFEIL